MQLRLLLSSLASPTGLMVARRYGDLYFFCVLKSIVFSYTNEFVSFCSLPTRLPVSCTFVFIIGTPGVHS
jgi:hypothetical protein